MTPPVIIYLGMGLIVARIALDGVQTRRFTWLEWLQFLVDAARITFLWPLVLFIEKFEAWLKSDLSPASIPAAPDGSAAIAKDVTKIPVDVQNG